MMILILSALLGCGGECETVELTDANNYTFFGDIDIPSYPTAIGEDIEICWDDLTVDLQCHEIDPAQDIDTIGMVRFNYLDQAQVEAGVNADSLKQADVSGYVEVYNDLGETCTSMTNMSFFGTEIDVVAEYVEGNTYLLNLTSGNTPGVGSRALVFLEPDPESEVTRVELGDACGMLEVDVDAQSLTPTTACEGGAFPVNWQALTVDGQGNPLTLADVDQVMVGHYADWSVQDLETNFLDIEVDATSIWQLDHAGGVNADLGAAVDADGNAFTGVTDQGLWVLALRCSACYNPAPLFLTVLEPPAE